MLSETRDHAKEILKELGSFFMIRFWLWRKRKAIYGRDQQWLLILKKEG